MTNTGTQAPRNSSASLRKALTILQFIGQDTRGEGFTVAQISADLDLNKSTVLRLMQPLLDTNFLELGESTGTYRLGWQNANLGQAYLAGVRADRDMHEILVHLSSQTKETAHLVHANAPYVVYIDKVDSPHAVRMVSRVGSTQPMYSTSVGKCILAHADEPTRSAVISAGMPQRTPATITSLDALDAELARIRDQGWAIDDVENEEGIRCVAAPIFDADGRCGHAISVSGPIARMPKSRVPDLAPVVTDAAQEISRRMGAPNTSGARS